MKYNAVTVTQLNKYLKDRFDEDELLSFDDVSLSLLLVLFLFLEFLLELLLELLLVLLPKERKQGLPYLYQE